MRRIAMVSLFFFAWGTACGGADHAAADASTPDATASEGGAVLDAAEEEASAPPGEVKYLSQLGAKCDGSDDTLAVIAAVTGARNNAYTLVVDCVATLDIGLNIDRSVFIDNDTTIAFGGNGKFIIDNLFEPAFVIANTKNVTLSNWSLEWKGSMPVSLNTAGYSIGGQFQATGTNGSGHFNDEILSSWLTKNRGVIFADGPTHGIWANWLGSVNVSSIFFIIGDTTNVTITGLDLHSADTSDPSKYVPFGFMFGANFKSNQTITTASPKATDTNASQVFAVPTALKLEGITLDGIIMGFQGNTIGSTFNDITAKHISDLQDANGNNVGGVGQSFPPPHLFYLNYQYEGDPALFNSKILITNVNEVGPRLGNVRPGAGGYADSLKLGCMQCSVDGYKTNRKDGFMDVLDSDGLSVSNVVASYDSSFVDAYVNWPGWRWPGGGSVVYFKNVTFSHVLLTDEAATTISAPMSNNTASANANIVMNDVNVVVQSWTQGNILPAFTGLATGSFVTFTLKTQGATQILK